VFDIGLQELIIIFLVALLVFGPKKLPELAKTLGKGLGDLKRAFQDVKDHVETEFDETNKTIDTAFSFLSEPYS
jgi:TatA/E family protein of Tat protein translocase